MGVRVPPAESLTLGVTVGGWATPTTCMRMGERAGQSRPTRGCGLLSGLWLADRVAEPAPSPGLPVAAFSWWEQEGNAGLANNVGEGLEVNPC